MQECLCDKFPFSTESTSGTSEGSRASRRITPGEVDVIASTTGIIPEDIMKKIDESRKLQELDEEIFGKGGKPPTLNEIDSFFSKKIKVHERAIIKLQEKQGVCIEVAQDFWESVRKAQAVKLKKRIGKHGARPRVKTAMSRHP